MDRSATISKDSRYRYTLVRSWAPERGRVCWIMLNPSTADASIDDPTIRRCIRFTESFGKGELIVVNLCAYRATDPDDLRQKDLDPVGPENGGFVWEGVAQADIVIAAWGSLHPTLTKWADFVVSLIKKDKIQLWCLGVNKDGSPKHPLYIAKDRPLIKWPMVSRG